MDGNQSERTGEGARNKKTCIKNIRMANPLIRWKLISCGTCVFIRYCGTERTHIAHNTSRFDFGQRNIDTPKRSERRPPKMRIPLRGARLCFPRPRTHARSPAEPAPGIINLLVCSNFPLFSSAALPYTSRYCLFSKQNGGIKAKRQTY